MSTKKESLGFSVMEKTDVTPYIEKKGRFSYLSWPYAVSAFRKACPDGFWCVKYNSNGLPCLADQSGAYVAVTAYTSTECPGFTQIHPVLDHKNKPVKNPDSYQVNTSIQRCLVKAIAIATGIGLHIYAGEDLPPADPVGPAPIESQLMLALNGAVDLATLGLIWGDERFQADLKTLSPGVQEMVTTTKENRKAILQGGAK